jgi:hypothetical protein
MNAAYQIVICGNDETICDGYTDDRTDCWRDEIGLAYVDAATVTVDEARLSGRNVGFTVDDNFHEWHDGRHYGVGGRYKPGFRLGCVVCHGDNLPAWVEDLVEAAHSAGARARDEFIAELVAAAVPCN